MKYPALGTVLFFHEIYVKSHPLSNFGYRDFLEINVFETIGLESQSDSISPHLSFLFSPSPHKRLGKHTVRRQQFASKESLLPEPDHAGTHVSYFRPLGL